MTFGICKYCEEAYNTNVGCKCKKAECPYCKSNDIVKFGKRYCKDMIKQIYFCNKCKKKFIDEKDLQKMKGGSKVTAQILNMHFKGSSLSEISNQLKKNYNLTLHKSNISRRIQKYSKTPNQKPTKQEKEKVPQTPKKKKNKIKILQKELTFNQQKVKELCDKLGVSPIIREKV